MDGSIPKILFCTTIPWTIRKRKAGSDLRCSLTMHFGCYTYITGFDWIRCNWKITMLTCCRLEFVPVCQSVTEQACFLVFFCSVEVVDIDTRNLWDDYIGMSVCLKMGLLNPLVEHHFTIWNSLEVYGIPHCQTQPNIIVLAIYITHITHIKFICWLVNFPLNPMVIGYPTLILSRNPSAMARPRLSGIAFTNSCLESEKG